MNITMRVVKMPDMKKLSKRALAKVPAALNVAAMKAEQIILDRTSKSVGLSPWGKYTDYSEGYAKKRIETGRSLRPNLFWSGQMLGSMTHTKPTNKKTVIYFAGRSNAMKAAFNNKIRPFFGLSTDERSDVSNVFKRYLGV